MVEEKIHLKLTDVVGTGGRYQRFTQAFQFYYNALLGMAQITVEILAPMITMHWSSEDSSSNRTEFKSNDCRRELINGYRLSLNLTNMTDTIIYKSEYSRNTITEHFDLVCERSWLVSFANTLFILGACVGSTAGGLSERFGRKFCIIFLLVLTFLSCVGILFSQNYIMFAAFIFLYGGTITQPVFLILNLAIEIMPPETARYQGIIAKSGFLCGQLIIVAAAWLLKDWFYIQLVQTLLVACIFLSVWYYQESPMWLAVRGKYEEAKTSIIKIAGRNRLDAEDIKLRVEFWLAEMQNRCEIQSQAEKGHYKDLFKNRRIAFFTVSTCFMWISMRTILVGLMVNAESFGSGLLLDLTLSSVISMITVIIVALFLRKVSVRNVLIISFVSEAVVCTLYPILNGFLLARTVLLVLGRLFVSCVFCVIAVYNAELFPTSVRGVSMGFVMFVSSLLSIPSPFTKELAEKTAVYAPFIIYTGLSVISAVLLWLLPDTSKQELTQTVDEVMNKGNGHKSAPISTISTENM